MIYNVLAFIAGFITYLLISCYLVPYFKNRKNRKDFRTVMIVLFAALSMSSCCKSETKKKYLPKEEIVYKGHRWDMVKINDSIYAIVPGLNSGKDAIPVVVNIKHVKSQ